MKPLGDSTEVRKGTTWTETAGAGVPSNENQRIF